ncbi:uncharacterized protein V1516DRAFT_667922 [Lipomyces oligophaga]|uniref:uncharacterized protein n=1 Tax=Lipomyces oligophaga TaxID=45792 RepID=UPI0034CF136A
MSSQRPALTNSPASGMAAALPPISPEISCTARSLSPHSAATSSAGSPIYFRATAASDMTAPSARPDSPISPSNTHSPFSPVSNYASSLSSNRRDSASNTLAVFSRLQISRRRRTSSSAPSPPSFGRHDSDFTNSSDDNEDETEDEIASTMRLLLESSYNSSHSKLACYPDRSADCELPTGFKRGWGWQFSASSTPSNDSEDHTALDGLNSHHRLRSVSRGRSLSRHHLNLVATKRSRRPSHSRTRRNARCFYDSPERVHSTDGHSRFSRRINIQDRQVSRRERNRSMSPFSSR